MSALVPDVFPLTLTLSPKGRGDCVVHFADVHALTPRLPVPRDAAGSRTLPLPLGERAGVRGALQQSDLSRMRARQMRPTMTPAEHALWQALRDRRFLGLKFRRQVPLGPYIADFYCAERALIIEADGDSHGALPDRIRDLWLQDKGFRTLRLWNRDIRGNLPGCLEWIAGEIAP